MKVINLGQADSVLNTFVAQIRDRKVQKDSMRFRTNLERIGELFAYEISRTLNYQSVEVETPLGIAATRIPSDKLVLGTILRAGIPIHQGLLNVFDDAQSCFIAAYRKYGKDNKPTIKFEYSSGPSVEGKVLVLSDAMLATGASMAISYEKLCESGTPVYTHIVSPIVSEYSVEYLKKHLPSDKVTLWTAAIDEELTNKSFVIPGLGDAGDLAYGSKV